VNHIYPKGSWVILVTKFSKGNSFGGVTFVNEIFCGKTGCPREMRSAIMNKY